MIATAGQLVALALALYAVLAPAEK